MSETTEGSGPGAVTDLDRVRRLLADAERLARTITGPHQQTRALAGIAMALIEQSRP
ncbi:hypothetical protein [Actinomadura sp. 6N118]|uniref:hypothetical protein n=1 Tax=Actinomadura sp. 6N118 TaxID=3375151 RepID=UPI00378A0278